MKSGKRIRVIVGHFGSGKTEFSINYALFLKKQGLKTALVDIDIANPYFRSRERQSFIEEKGINIYSNTFGYDITADLPAITAAIKSPLEDKFCHTVVDVGGNNSGARVLIQFEKYFTPEESDIFCVVNANRPETADIEGALRHIREIEEETGLKVTGLINNTHLLRETGPEDIFKGYELCKSLEKHTDIPLIYNCCVESLIDEAELELKKHGGEEAKIFPIKLYMRDTWLDR